MNTDVTEQRKADLEREQGIRLNQALIEINQILLSTLDFDEMMKRTITSACSALTSESAAISLRKNGRWVVGYVSGFPHDVIGMEMNDDEERHAILAIETRQPVAITDAFNDERVNIGHMRKWGVRSVLVVPITHHDEAIGVMFFNFQSQKFEFQDIHTQFAVNLAASISAALSNANLVANLQKEIQERKKAEEELRRSEQRWGTTLASIGDAVIATDAQGRISFMNPVAEDLTGWSLAEAKSREMGDVFEIINEHSRKTVENPAIKVLALGKVVGLANHTILIRRDGKEVPIDDSGAPIRDSHGNVMGVVLVFRDISARKLAEKMNDEYARKLEQSNKELENFAYIASHDLQEPLRKISTFSKLITENSDHSLGEIERSYLDRMQKAAERMQNMIDDLLALSQVTAQLKSFTP